MTRIAPDGTYAPVFKRIVEVREEPRIYPIEMVDRKIRNRFRLRESNIYSDAPA